ncbi:MAG: GreA/GreB family elongation factor [Candidatus Aegiribacteria sp.]
MSKLMDAARAGERDRLTDIWLEALEGTPSFDEMGDALSVLTSEGREELAGELLELTISEKELEGGADFEGLLLRCAELFHENEPLRKALIELVRDRYLMFQPLEHFLQISGLRKSGADVARCWKEFMGLMSYRTGGYLYHRTFGTGLISRVSRTHVTADFPAARQHDMELDVALETTVPLEEESLAVLSLEDPAALRDLLTDSPEEFLRRLLGEPFVSGKGLSEEDLAPLAGPDLEADRLWKMVKNAASDAGGYADLGNRVVAVDESVELVEQVREILARRKVPVSKKVLQIRSLLKSFSGPASGDLDVLLPEVAMIKSPETGSLFELSRILSGRGGSRFVETSAARAERALSEMHSQSCRKAYLESFFEGEADREEKKAMLASLRRSLWEHAVSFLEDRDPELLSECISLFLSSPSRTDLFLWSLIYLAAGGKGMGEKSPETGVEIFLDNLIFASADTQKRVAGLLMGPLREELNRYLASIDTRKLTRYLESFDSSATAHNEGLVLAVNREISRRRSSGGRRASGKRFWEGETLFSSREAIKSRKREILKLRQVEIPAAAEAIGEAASHGDLSENAEYAAAMEKRDLLLDRLRRWSEELKRFRPYPADEISAEVVSPGVRVTLQDTDGSEDVQVLEVVGPLDARPEEGRINYSAPLGKALLGLSQGDVVELPGAGGGEWRVVTLEVLPLIGR